jgi:hypothetical protein
LTSIIESSTPATQQQRQTQQKAHTKRHVKSAIRISRGETNQSAERQPGTARPPSEQQQQPVEPQEWPRLVVAARPLLGYLGNSAGRHSISCYIAAVAN